MTAKLLHSLLLCNDIHLKTLIDIVPYDQEHLLITCGSFIKRYNLNTRKQVNSWITKSWHVFTSGAVKDPSSKEICGVINDQLLCMWPIEEDDIENVLKHKLKSRIKSLEASSKHTYIIYKCGFVESLNSGIQNRKVIKKQIIEKTEEIFQHQVFEDRKEVSLLVKNKVEEIFLYKIEIGTTCKLLYRNRLQLFNFNLTGSSIFSCGTLLTTWSDGNLYSMNILKKRIQTNPGSIKGRLNLLNQTKKNRILKLSPTHIALQGMNVNEEGGAVVLWDVKFSVAVDMKPLKMYRDPPLAWSVGSGLVVGDGVVLVYIPVHLVPSTVASMLGSRIEEKSNYHEEIVGWDSSSQAVDSVLGADQEKPVSTIPVSAIKTILSNKSSELVDVLGALNKGSTSEDVVSYLAIMHCMGHSNLRLLMECLSSFSDLSEKSLVTLMKYFIELPDDELEKVQALTHTKMESTPKSIGKSPKVPKKKLAKERNLNGKDSPSVNGIGVDDEKKDKKGAEPVFSSGKSVVVNQILLKSFTSWELSNALRILDFKNSLLLLEHLHFLLASGQAPMLKDKTGRVPTVEKICTWLSLLLDSNYHQLVMTSEVEIHRKLLTCFSDVTDLHKILQESYGLDALVDTVLNSKSLPKTQVDSPYSIERLVI